MVLERLLVLPFWVLALLQGRTATFFHQMGWLCSRSGGDPDSPPKAALQTNFFVEVFEDIQTDYSQEWGFPKMVGFPNNYWLAFLLKMIILGWRLGVPPFFRKPTYILHWPQKIIPSSCSLQKDGLHGFTGRKFDGGRHFLVGKCVPGSFRSSTFLNGTFWSAKLASMVTIVWICVYGIIGPETTWITWNHM